MMEISLTMIMKWYIVTCNTRANKNMLVITFSRESHPQRSRRKAGERISWLLRYVKNARSSICENHTPTPNFLNACSQRTPRNHHLILKTIENQLILEKQIGQQNLVISVVMRRADVDALRQTCWRCDVAWRRGFAVLRWSRLRYCNAERSAPENAYCW
jgi:hypothetical protein